MENNDEVRTMNYTIELSNDEGERLIVAFTRNDIYGDGKALAIVQDAVRAGQMTATPTAFAAEGVSYSEVIEIAALDY